tara:strand:+ start:573 stop:1709 length:1137 start_codon:yes stop_codon:yes gene_type:complete
MNSQAHYKENVFNHGPDYFDAILRDIDNAKKSIIIEIYAFKIDPLGKKILKALKDASKRGVSVRVLVDGAGTPSWHGRYINQLEASGAQTKVFHPFPWQFWQWHRSVSQLPLLLRIFFFITHVNSRTHRKIFIIDEKITYIGSFNIDVRHIGINGSRPWRDTGVRLENAEIDLLLATFEKLWHPPARLRERIQHFTTHRTYDSIRLNHNRQNRRNLYKYLLRRIAKSKKRIWITNAYFVPNIFLLKKLKDAAKKGVDVRILLPKYSDVPMMPWTSRTFYYGLLTAGIRIFEYRPSMLHAKTIVLDDRAYVGTSNLNHRSLLHDLEIDVSLKSPDNRASIAKDFLRDIKEADEVAIDRPHHRWYQRSVGRILFYLRYLM